MTTDKEPENPERAAEPEVPLPALEVQPPPTSVSIGPGPLYRSDQSPLLEQERLGFLVLDTEFGACTFGSWASLHPNLKRFFEESPEFYLSSVVTLLHEDFVQITPPKPWPKNLLGTGTPSVIPFPGLAYANGQGNLLISVSDAKPPEGYAVIGQAIVDQHTVDELAKQTPGEPKVTVYGAGGLKT